MNGRRRRAAGPEVHAAPVEPPPWLCAARGADPGPWRRGEHRRVQRCGLGALPATAIRRCRSALRAARERSQDRPDVRNASRVEHRCGTRNRPVRRDGRGIRPSCACVRPARRRARRARVGPCVPRVPGTARRAPLGWADVRRIRFRHARRPAVVRHMDAQVRRRCGCHRPRNPGCRADDGHDEAAGRWAARRGRVAASIAPAPAVGR